MLLKNGGAIAPIMKLAKLLKAVHAPVPCIDSTCTSEALIAEAWRAARMTLCSARAVQGTDSEIRV